MVAGLGWVLLAVFGIFGAFMAALAYAQWATRGMDVYRADRP